MQFLRSTGFNLIMFGSGTVLSLYCILVARFRPGGILRIARLWARICLWGLRTCCGITVAVEGLEYLPEGGAVIAAQHQSALDILAWLVILPRPAFVFKKELRRIPLFGSLLEPAGMVPVNRGGGGAALREMVAAASRATAEGRQLIIFPEGTRVPHGTRGRIRNGVVALAQAVNVPVLPASTNTGLRWSRKSFDQTAGQVHVTLHPALPQGLTRDDIVTRLETIFYGAVLRDEGEGRPGALPLDPTGAAGPRPLDFKG